MLDGMSCQRAQSVFNSAQSCFGPGLTQAMGQFDDRERKLWYSFEKFMLGLGKGQQARATSNRRPEAPVYMLALYTTRACVPNQLGMIATAKHSAV